MYEYFVENKIKTLVMQIKMIEPTDKDNSLLFSLRSLYFTVTMNSAIMEKTLEMVNNLIS